MWITTQDRMGTEQGCCLALGEQENSVILELRPREELQREQNRDAPNAKKPQ